MSDFLAAAGLQSVDAENNPVSTTHTTLPAPVVPEPVAPVAPVEPITPTVPDPPAALTPEETAIVAQAEKPDAVERLIEAERAKAREANARRRELEAQALAAAQASIPLEQRLASEAQRANEAERKVAQILVAAKHNIPLDLAERLKGDSVEALEQDAQQFFGHLKAPGTPAALVIPPSGANGGYQPTPPIQQDPNKAHGQWLADKLRNPTGA